MREILNPYLEFYRERLAHETLKTRRGYRSDQPSHFGSCCLPIRCLPEDPRKRFSWAIPNNDALKAIADHSPSGVVEIGAGAGYWARMLREIGVDVIAYDPQPKDSPWHVAGEKGGWSEVLTGDHTAVIGHSDRTLLTVWPEYEALWSQQMLELYEGETVIYVGEGAGGCTGNDGFHALLGEGLDCYCFDRACTCPPKPEVKFTEVSGVSIPQWNGLHDYLNIYKRKES